MSGNFDRSAEDIGNIVGLGESSDAGGRVAPWGSGPVPSDRKMR